MPFFLLGGLALIWLVSRKSSPAPATHTAPPPPPPAPVPQQTTAPTPPLQAPAPTFQTPPVPATRTPPPVVTPVQGPPSYTTDLAQVFVIPQVAPVPATPTPAPPAPSPAAPSGPSGPNASMIAQCLQLTNAARAAGHNCADGTGWNPVQPAYRWNATLARVAQAHSDWMAANHVLSHQDSGGNPGQRVTAAGYQWQHVAENVAMGAQSAQEAVDGWLASTDGHCANIMSSKSTEIGIGVARASDGTLFWTQDFAKSL